MLYLFRKRLSRKCLLYVCYYYLDYCYYGYVHLVDDPYGYTSYLASEIHGSLQSCFLGMTYSHGFVIGNKNHLSGRRLALHTPQFPRQQQHALEKPKPGPLLPPSLN